MVTSPEGSIVVVEAHAVIATSLVLALRHAGFGSARSTHPDALELDGESRSDGLARGDVVVLGPLLGEGGDPLPLLPPLVNRGCSVVVLADQGLPLVGECLRRGAAAVFDRDTSFESLVGWLGVLLAGGTVMGDDERAELVERVEHHAALEEADLHAFAALTAREAVVLNGLVDGFSPKQIAHSEGISIFTVRGHIQRILRKLRVNSQREALAMARHGGWPSLAG